MNRHQVFQAVSSAISASATNEPSVEIRSHRPAGDGMARIVADVYHTSESRADHGLVLNVLGKKFQGKVTAVRGSFESVSKTQFVERVTGLVATARQSVFADGDLKGFRSLSSNMFMDEEENMWVLRRNSNGNLLIKTTGVEDDTALASLLEATCSVGGSGQANAFASLSSYAPPSVQGGDAINYVNANNQTVLGFVVASVQGSDDLIVQPFDAEDTDVIKPAAITDVHNIAEFPEDEMEEAESLSASVSSARGVTSIAEIAAYYKRVFARNKGFYAEFMKRFRGHKFA